MDDPGDWVHAELIYGLSTVGVTVVPVRVDDADWPAADDLPAPLRALAVLNAATVSHDRWDNDWEPLLDRIAALVCRERADKADRTQRRQPMGRGAGT